MEVAGNATRHNNAVLWYPQDTVLPDNLIFPWLATQSNSSKYFFPTISKLARRDTLESLDNSYSVLGKEDTVLPDNFILPRAEYIKQNTEFFLQLGDRK